MKKMKYRVREYLGWPPNKIEIFKKLGKIFQNCKALSNIMLFPSYVFIPQFIYYVNEYKFNNE